MKKNNVKLVKKQLKEIPIFFATDDNYIPYLDVAIRSLIKNASKYYKYTINILNTGIKEENIEIVKRNECENVTISFRDISEDIKPIKNRLKGLYHFSAEMYYRLFIENIFPQYDKVLYLDCDIVVVGDISRLYNTALGDKWIAGVTERLIYNHEVFSKYVKVTTGVDPINYINSGILVMNLKKLREVNLAEQFMYVLSKYNITIDEATLTAKAQNNYWLSNLGVPLYNVGKLLEEHNLLVIRKYDADIDMLINLLEGKEGELKHDAIVVVNNDLLTGNESENYFADDNPNHAVVVNHIDKEKGIVELYNPSTGNTKDTYQLDIFIQSWSESKNYLVLVREKQYEHEYCPNPIDVSGVTLSPDLEELIDTIAENTHNVWAVDKIKKNPGIRYAPKDENGNEIQGHNHFLLPYSELSDEDKEYDIQMATQTIKLLKRIGYRLVNVNTLHRCSSCGEPIEMHHVYCSHCGKKLTWEDFK